MKSGFNLLSLKKADKNEVKRYFKRHLVVGDDLYALSLVNDLIEKGEGEGVAWISPKEITKDDLAPCGPTSLRGQQNIDVFKRRYPHISLSEYSEAALFFKELKWRPFGGRAKSEPLQWGESFYTQERASFAPSELYPFINNEERLNEIFAKRLDLDVTNLRQVMPEDLAEPAHFKLNASNGDEISCEHLYWGRGPSSLIDLYAHMEDLSPGFIEFCESTKTPSSLFITLKFDGVVTDMKETLFIPLSYTHEWGHFIGEFSEEANGKQSVSFVTFLDENASSEEDISKKIRLLKRNLEKIFPEITKISSEEFIKIANDTACLNVDDGAFEKESDVLKNFHFISNSAPLKTLSSDHLTSADSLGVVAATTRAVLASELQQL